MAKTQRQLTVQVLVEDDEDAIHRTVSFVKTSLKGSCRNLNSGAVVVALYDEDDRLAGLDITGKPSEDMQEMVENLFGEEQVVS